MTNSKSITVRNRPIITNNFFKDDIYLVQQFFIHSNSRRQNEILFCLKKNTQNENIKKIFLLNERLYTQDEMKLTNDEFKRIEQIIIKTRLTYKDFFDFIADNKINKNNKTANKTANKTDNNIVNNIDSKNLNGYVILSNSDIYFNETLKNLYKTDLSIKKACFMQLRLGDSQYFMKTYGSSSQDAWIFHTNTTPPKHINKIFDFNLGVLGCDNKIAYYFYRLKYKLYNEPYRIHTIHVHKTKIRNWKKKDRIKPPYAEIAPNYIYRNDYKQKQLQQPSNIQSSKKQISNKQISNKQISNKQISNNEHKIIYDSKSKKQNTKNFNKKIKIVI